jgi:hypothetical protein
VATGVGLAVSKKLMHNISFVIHKQAGMALDALVGFL